MKNFRADQPSSHLYLASKRSSLNHDKLPQPYKIEWGTTSFQNTDNRSSSNKNFFQNMKDQLSNIKQDFEKLIKKQNSFSSVSKPIKEESLPSTAVGFGSGSKGKSLSSYKKDNKKYLREKMEDPDKMEMVMNLHLMEENSHAKFYNSEKQQPLSQKKAISKTVDMKDKEYTSTNPLHRLQNRLFEEKEEKVQQEGKVRKERNVPQPVVEREIDRKEEEIQMLKEQISALNQEILLLRKQRQDLKGETLTKNHENQDLKRQKQTLISKMTELSQQLKNKMEYAQHQDNTNKQLSMRLKDEQNHNSQHYELVNEQIEKERAFYKQQINELVFHNQNFDKINMELGAENQNLKQNLSNLQNFVEHLKSINENAENDNKRKQEFMKKDVEQYQKRQKMLQKQIQALSAQLLRKSSEVQNHSDKESFVQSEIDSEHLRSEIQNLQAQIKTLQSQLELQKEINCAVRSKYESEHQKGNMQDIKNTLQKRMNDLIDDNARLKSRINALEAELDSFKEQNRSYLKQIDLYQERQKSSTKRKQLSSSEWQELNQQIEKLTLQNQFLQEKLQLKTLKEEVSRQDHRFQEQPNEQIVKLAHIQLQQIQKMKQKVQSYKSENQFLTKELEIQGETNLTLKKQISDIAVPSKKSSQKKHCCYLKELEMVDRKNEQINSLKTLIFKVMVEKVGKREDEGDNKYCLRKIEELKPLLIGL